MKTIKKQNKWACLQNPEQICRPVRTSENQIWHSNSWVFSTAYSMPPCWVQGCVLVLQCWWKKSSPLHSDFLSLTPVGGREAACYDCVNTLFTFLFAVFSPTMLREGFYTVRATFTPQILTPQGYYNVSISVTAVFGALFLCSVIVLDPFCSSKAQHKPALQSQGAENCSPTQHCSAQAPCPCALCSNPHLGPGKNHCRKENGLK